MKKLFIITVIILTISNIAYAREYFTIEITSKNKRTDNVMTAIYVRTVTKGIEKTEQQNSHLPFSKTYFTDKLTTTIRVGQEIVESKTEIKKDVSLTIKIYRSGKLHKVFENEGLGNQINIIMWHDRQKYESWYEENAKYKE